MTTGSIDRQVERLVREALYSAVSRDAERLQEAFDAISTDLQEAALGLCVAIDAQVIQGLFDEAPDIENVMDLSREFKASESWVDTESLPVDEFFARLIGSTTDTEATAEELAVLPFLVGGWLLSTRTPEGLEWFEYLDDVLNVLDRAPRPSS